MKQYASDNFNYLTYYGASAREMIKFMEQPERYGDFDFEFVCGLFRAIDKTYKHYVIECPEIPAQTEEDRILASILIVAEYSLLSANTNIRLFNKSHIISYLKREDVIFNWNGWLMTCIQREVEEMKKEMRVKLGVVG